MPRSKKTGIKVSYDTFETNEALNAKLVAGNTGYDIVVPGTAFNPRRPKLVCSSRWTKPAAQLQEPGPAIMGALVKADPTWRTWSPWAWGFTTVGINKTKVEGSEGHGHA